MKKVIFDFYNELNVKNNKDTIVVKPEGFNRDNDTVEVRQYVIDLSIQHLLEKGEIIEGNFEVQVY